MNGAGAILLKSGGAAYVPPKNGEDPFFRLPPRGGVICVARPSHHSPLEGESKEAMGLIRGENAG